ncbi:hypothetical protein TTHERM_00760840 (macronuclear) [Tetrahymena thermophila SB210]|uniref:Kinase domain protein n=1 Tax=Tetrahymena thermophila (strain SB210) TaxID=312017 RepID=I7LT10_TETTS|nr:hypothetical protein TTHERM_00760840 [Tetrahymena thermophila SB210]EAR84037.1 hypothetical protein TTHERM_00760840 [Tetrahymena thermophila SB210]|eukprot:XP_001031700.1 hypothetical protein TTHERM_00760840 [Tetrahymena thermophila SB210]
MSLDTFYLINKCYSLTQLEISLKDNIRLSITQNYNLGQCFKQLLCLNSLKLKFNCKYFFNLFEQLNMREAYQNLHNLKDFQLIFQEKNKEFQQIFDQFFDGLRYSKNLQSLLVGFKQRFIVKNSMFFDKLDEEIGHLSQLKNLSIKISRGSSICSSNMLLLGKIINKLPQLSKLSISTPFSKQPQNTKFIGIENSILRLQNLKELSIKIVENSQIILSFIKDAVNLNEFQLSIQTYEGDEQSQRLSSTEIPNFLQNISKLQKFKLCLSQKTEIFSFISGDLFCHLTRNPIIDLQLTFKGEIQLSHQFLQEMKSKFEEPNYEDFQELFENISKLPKLNSLFIDLGDLRFTKEDCINLKYYLSNLKLLNEIRIQSISFNTLYLVNLFDELPLIQDVELMWDFTNGQLIEIIIQKQIYCNKQKYFQFDQINNHNQINTLNERFKLKLKIDQLFKKEDLISMSWCFENIRKLTNLDLIIYNNSKVTQNDLHQLFMNLKILNNLQTDSNTKINNYA